MKFESNNLTVEMLDEFVKNIEERGFTYGFGSGGRNHAKFVMRIENRTLTTKNLDKEMVDLYRHNKSIFLILGNVDYGTQEFYYDLANYLQSKIDSEEYESNKDAYDLLDKILVAVPPDANLVDKKYVLLYKDTDGWYKIYEKMPYNVFETQINGKLLQEKKDGGVIRFEYVSVIEEEVKLNYWYKDELGLDVLQLNTFTGFPWLDKELVKKARSDNKPSVINDLLDHVFMGNKEMIHLVKCWMARAIFYRVENALYLIELLGGAGKSLLMNLLGALLDELFASLNSDVLTGTFDSQIAGLKLAVFEEADVKGSSKVKQIVGNKTYSVRRMFSDKKENVKTPAIAILANKFDNIGADKVPSENRRVFAPVINKNPLTTVMSTEDISFLWSMVKGGKNQSHVEMVKFGLELLDLTKSDEFSVVDNAIYKTRNYWDIVYGTFKPWQKTVFDTFVNLNLNDLPRHDYLGVKVLDFKRFRRMCKAQEETFKPNTTSIINFLKNFTWRGVKLCNIIDHEENGKNIEYIEPIIHCNFNGYDVNSFDDFENLDWPDKSQKFYREQFKPIKQDVLEEDEDLFSDL